MNKTMVELNARPDAATGTTTAKKKQIVYVVTIDDVVDWNKEYHQPRVFSKREDAIKCFKESYEEIKNEFDEGYIFDYEEDCYTACIYDYGRWASDHWEIEINVCEIDNID